MRLQSRGVTRAGLPSAGSVWEVNESRRVSETAGLALGVIHGKHHQSVVMRREPQRVQMKRVRPASSSSKGESGGGKRRKREERK